MDVKRWSLQQPRKCVIGNPFGRSKKFDEDRNMKHLEGAKASKKPLLINSE
jgi:hypothetical protein